MLWVWAGLAVILLWAWWFDRYRRRPRRGAGAIDDTALERDRSLADRTSIHGVHQQHHHGGSFGGGGG